MTVSHVATGLVTGINRFITTITVAIGIDVPLGLTVVTPLLDIGIVGSMPLSVPASYGSWTLSAGVHYLMLGDNTEAANGGDDDEVIATIGISMGY